MIVFLVIDCEEFSLVSDAVADDEAGESGFDSMRLLDLLDEHCGREDVCKLFDGLVRGARIAVGERTR